MDDAAARRLARLQRAQHGLVARRQAAGLGVPTRTLDGRVQSGRYRRVVPGVYAEAGTPIGWHARVLAAVLWAGDDAAASSWTAAGLLGLDAPPSAVHLLVRQRTFRAPAGVVVHRSQSFVPAHVRPVDGIPATTPARTLCDLAAVASAPRLRRLVAAAARDGLVDATALRAVLAAVGRTTGVGRLRGLVDELSPLDAQCASPLESAFLRVARRGGVEPTAMNHEVRDRHGRRRRFDAVYLPAHLPVELDSARFHSTRLDRADDADRERALDGVDGWRRPLRFTWADVHDAPDAVVATLRAALRGSAPPGDGSGVPIAHER